MLRPRLSFGRGVPPAPPVWAAASPTRPKPALIFFRSGSWVNCGPGFRVGLFAGRVWSAGGVEGFLCRLRRKKKGGCAVLLGRLGKSMPARRYARRPWPAALDRAQRNARRRWAPSWRRCPAPQGRKVGRAVPDRLYLNEGAASLRRDSGRGHPAPQGRARHAVCMAYT